MSVRSFKELPGFKDGHTAELESIGIKTIGDLAKAVKDDEKVKQLIKTLSGIGPKTMDKWKDALEGSDRSESRSEDDVPKKEQKPKDKTKDKSEKKTEIVEKESEIVESDAYIPKAKPELDGDTADALAKRAMISGRRPEFKRQEWFRYAKLGEKWRRPKGIHSKQKRNLARRPPVVDIGYRGPRDARGLHPSGFEEVLVHTVDGLEGIDPKVQAVRIGGTVGTRKRIQIEDRAEELGIRVLNRMV